jgi:hypothetical protein
MSGEVSPITGVEEVYRKYAQAFSALENIFFDAHAIPQEITRDAIKQRILGAQNRELFSLWLTRPRNGIASLAWHMATMFYLMRFALSGHASNSASVDVLFDAWSRNSGDFYGGIINALPARNVGAFGPYVSALNGISDANKFFRATDRVSPRVAWRVIKTHFALWRKYHSLNKASGIDVHDLALRLCLEVARHISCIEGISAKVIISANDNGYTPYRSWLYRAHGIDRIFLIQNGARVELKAFYNSYIHCDYFFGWSQHRLNSFLEMRCEKKSALGSSRLSSFLATQRVEHVDHCHDLLFIEQVYGASSSRHSVYLSFLRHLVRYADERPRLRIAYCLRPLRYAEDVVGVKTIDAILKPGRFTVLESSSNISSYQHMLNSKLVVSCDSSLRYEAVVLGKMILSCSDRRELFDYVVQASAPCFVVSSDEYTEFSEKIDFLLGQDKVDAVSTALNRMINLWRSDQSFNVAEKIARTAIECCAGEV